MRIRQFTAPTTAAALRELRETLGDEALVLSTRSEPGGVVITAAVDAGDGAGEGADASYPAPAWAGADGRDDDLRFDVALIRTRLEQLGRKVHRMDRTLLELGAGVRGARRRGARGRRAAGRERARRTRRAAGRAGLRARDRARAPARRGAARGAARARRGRGAGPHRASRR